MMRMSSSVGSGFSALTLAKKQLRKEVKARLNCLDRVAWKSQSDIVCQKVINHEKFKAASTVAVYLAMEGTCEINTDPIIQHVFRNTDKRLFIPYICKQRNSESRPYMLMLELKDENDWHGLPKNRWGIKEPAENDIDGRKIPLDYGGLDLVVVPGVAFTSVCKRLGHGGGYYDRYMGQTKEAYLMGVALKEQIVDDLPTNENDVIIHEIISS